MHPGSMRYFGTLRFGVNDYTSAWAARCASSGPVSWRDEETKSIGYRMARTCQRALGSIQSRVVIAVLVVGGQSPPAPAMPIGPGPGDGAA